MTATPMTPVDTAAIAERVDAIPSGKYRVLPPEPNRYWLSICHTTPGNEPEDECFIIAEVSSIKILRADGSIDDNEAFAHFVAAAPADIRALLSENASLKAEVAALTARAEALQDALEPFAQMARLLCRNTSYREWEGVREIFGYNDAILTLMDFERALLHCDEPTPANGGSEPDDQ